MDRALEIGLLLKKIRRAGLAMEPVQLVRPGLRGFQVSVKPRGVGSEARPLHRIPGSVSLDFNISTLHQKPRSPKAQRAGACLNLALCSRILSPGHVKLESCSIQGVGCFHRNRVWFNGMGSQLEVSGFGVVGFSHLL